MEVLLISPPSRAINHYRPPLALMYLAGYLKNNNFDVKIIDGIIRKQIRNKSFWENKTRYLSEIEDKIIQEVISADADIVGITCYTTELDEAEQLANKIKSSKKDIKIIAGGIHPTLYPTDFLSLNSPFDFAVIGEGEITLFELIKQIRSGRGNYGSVNGIAFFDQATGKSVITGRRPLAHDLDTIAFPDYEDLDMEFYTTASPYAIRGVFTRSFYILSSRGCPSSCSFCVSKKLREHYGAQRFVRLRSPASLFKEIKELRDNYDIDSFYFIDDLFTLKKENVYEFCELMIKNKLSLIWGCSSKVNTVDYDMLKVMQEAGCLQIDFGVEKGSDRALKNLKKGITVQQIKKIFLYCRKLGIRTFANMLVNTPGETEDDLSDIVNLIREIEPNIVSFNIFSPYPGCEIYDSLCKNLGRDDYALLMNTAPLLKAQADKFRFALHDIDLLKWAGKSNKKYNKVLPNIKVYFNPKYLRSFIFSRRKVNYLKHAAFLVREFINQKF